MIIMSTKKKKLLWIPDCIIHSFQAGLLFLTVTELAESLLRGRNLKLVTYKCWYGVRILRTLETVYRSEERRVGKECPV